MDNPFTDYDKDRGAQTPKGKNPPPPFKPISNYKLFGRLKENRILKISKRYLMVIPSDPNTVH